MGRLPTVVRSLLGAWRVRHLLPVVGVLVAGGAFLIAPGGAATTNQYCTAQTGSVLRVDARGTAPLTITRDATSSGLLGTTGGTIRVNGVSCFYTNSSVAKIVVFGDAADNTVSIDQLQPMTPGKGTDTGTAEIEFEFDLGAGNDVFRMITGNAGSTLALGSAGSAFTTDTDNDITLANVESAVLEGRGGNDTLTGAGGFGTGAAFAKPATLIGAGGADTLTGGSSDDVAKPGLGNDILAGGLGRNILDYAEVTGAIQVNLPAGTVTGASGADSASQFQGANTGSGNDEVWDKDGERTFYDLGAGDDLYHSGVDRPSQEPYDPVTLIADVVRFGAGTDTYDATVVRHNSPGLISNLPLNLVNGSPQADEADHEVFIGSGGDDTCIDQDGERNVCSMGEGDDLMVAGTKKPVNDAPDASGTSDTFDGGPGNDTVDYTATEHNSPGMIINLPLNQANGSPEHDKIPNTENAIGSGGDDVCVDQDGEQNTCALGEGDDRFEAGVKKPVNDAPDATGKSDTWDGGPGNDTASYEATEHNSPGILANLPLNQVNGSPEFDSIPSVENIEGSTGDDQCVDQDGERNSCSMGEGDDVIFAGTKKPVNDAPDASGHSDSWDGGPGTDTVNYEATEHNSPGMLFNLPLGQINGSPEFDTEAGIETYIGGTGDDTVVHTPDAIDNIVLGDGDDVCVQTGTGTGADRCEMGAGFDTYDSSQLDVTSITADLPNDSVAASPADFFDGENFIGPDNPNAVVNAIGDDGDNTLQGGGGNDTLNGFAGNDTIRGGNGDDVIDCGAGSDTVSWSDSPNPVTITMSDTPGSGTATGWGNDTFVNCETIEASPNNDTINGSGGNDTVHAGAGDDTIFGNNGNDTLYGDAGNDRIDGGNNDDTIYGGDGDDIGDGYNGNDTLYGGAGNDELHGGANGTDAAFGEAGDDRVFGENGPDTLDGGEGNDLVDGGEGPDRCTTGETNTSCEH